MGGGHESGTKDNEEFLDNVEGKSCSSSRWMLCREDSNSVADAFTQHSDSEGGHVCFAEGVKSRQYNSTGSEARGLTPCLGTNLPKEMAEECHSEESDGCTCESLRRIVCVVSIEQAMSSTQLIRERER